jgi:hypothetical protein
MPSKVVPKAIDGLTNIRKVGSGAGDSSDNVHLYGMKIFRDLVHENE